jgi:uncharacterized protein (TIGR00369 family)
MHDLKTVELDGEWRSLSDDGFTGTIGPLNYRERDDLVEVLLLTSSKHKNLSGIVHGGVIMTLIDRVIGLNCARKRPGERTPTASLTVNFLRSVRVGEPLLAKCILRKLGRNALFVDAEVYVADILVATGTGTYLKADPIAHTAA